MQEYGGQPTYGGQTGYGDYGYGGYGPPPPPPRGPGLLRYLAVAVVAALLGAGVVVGVGHLGSSGTPVAQTAPTPGASSAPAQQPQQNEPSQPAQVPVGGSGLNSAEQAVVNKVSAGLVIINTALSYRAEQAAGTGMVVNADGLVLTNNHVIENATSISATVVATGKRYPAKVLGYDKTGDIAAIRLQGVSGLHTIPVGNSSTVKNGATVVAMGNAQGGSQIVPAVGQVTALNQTITANDQSGTVSSETLHGMIQTNAAIVSGDSGGAMANLSGQVIGMNTAGNNVQYGSQQATGFAVPINTALSVVDQIAAGHGSSTIFIGYPAFVGIFIPTSNSSNPQVQAQQQAQANGGFGGLGGGPGGGSGARSCYSNDASMPVPTTIAPATSGTLIIGTICGSPATAAGITGGDVITAVNGQQVGAPSQLQSILSKYGPGQTVSLTWENVSGQAKTGSLRLAAGPPQ
jgi:S1-C subfamily serine protease